MCCSLIPFYVFMSNGLKFESLTLLYSIHHNAQKMKFSIKVFFSKCDQIRSFLRIWLHLLQKSLTENFIFCSVSTVSISNSFWIISL